MWPVMWVTGPMYPRRGFWGLQIRYGSSEWSFLWPSAEGHVHGLAHEPVSHQWVSILSLGNTALIRFGLIVSQIQLDPIDLPTLLQVSLPTFEKEQGGRGTVKKSA